MHTSAWLLTELARVAVLAAVVVGSAGLILTVGAIDWLIEEKGRIWRGEDG